MLVEEKPTGKFNQNGTEKMNRKFFHKSCAEEIEKDKAFKQKEAKEFEDLYEYLKELHNIDALDGRMIERIQDFRNGTVKVQNQKVKKYKEGVTYKAMLDTYRYIGDQIERILHTNNFNQRKWNEFAYIFGTMVRNLNDVQVMLKQKQKEEDKLKTTIKKNIESESENYTPAFNNKKKKKDELDISDFL